MKTTSSAGNPALSISARNSPTLARYGRSGFCTTSWTLRPEGSLVEIEGEVVVHATPAGRQQVKALFYVDDRAIETLTFQRFSTADGRPTKDSSFTLRGEEIPKLLELVTVIKNTKFPGQGRVRIEETNLKDFIIDKEAARALAEENLEVVADVAEHHVTQRDITAFAYRKKELEHFRSLLHSQEYFEKTRGSSKPEAVWQAFFEKNPWIFGYGLSYIFTTALGDKKLEQVVAGNSVQRGGKRVDGLLRTRGRVSSLCFVEIKTHETPLLETQPYRRDSWAISGEIAGAVAQAQRSVQSAQETIGRRLDPTAPSGDPTGDPSYLFRPRSIVVAGNLAKFEATAGVNETRFGSFELFRRQLQTPEIITFDELYERARFIVETSQR